jgi:hypothetical protein
MLVIAAHHISQIYQPFRYFSLTKLLMISISFSNADFKIASWRNSVLDGCSKNPLVSD